MVFIFMGAVKAVQHAKRELSKDRARNELIRPVSDNVDVGTSSSWAANPELADEEVAAYHRPSSSAAIGAWGRNDVKQDIHESHQRQDGASTASVQSQPLPTEERERETARLHKSSSSAASTRAGEDVDPLLSPPGVDTQRASLDAPAAYATPPRSPSPTPNITTNTTTVPSTTPAPVAPRTPPQPSQKPSKQSPTAAARFPSSRFAPPGAASNITTTAPAAAAAPVSALPRATRKRTTRPVSARDAAARPPVAVSVVTHAKDAAGAIDVTGVPTSALTRRSTKKRSVATRAPGVAVRESGQREAHGRQAGGVVGEIPQPPLPMQQTSMSAPGSLRRKHTRRNQ